MKKTLVSPRIVWGFYTNVGISKSLVNHIIQNRWKNIPPVPVFQIPKELREENYEYFLVDGNHRRNAAEYLEQKLPTAIYNPDEIINTRRDKLAPFKHSSDPLLYSTILRADINRKNLAQLVTRRLI